jgi:hypothetical protein
MYGSLQKNTQTAKKKKTRAEVTTNWKDEYGNTVAQLSRTECFCFDVTNYFMTLFTDVFALALHDPVPAI